MPFTLYQIPRNRNHADRGQGRRYRNVDKELAGGAVFVSGTRHRMVPRVLRRPLSASFLIGGFGFSAASAR